MEHHNLDPYPIPKESQPLFINEPWLIDDSLQWYYENYQIPDPPQDADNIRFYMPMDICKSSMLRRLDYVIKAFGTATYANETDYSCQVDKLISQIEIYDQVWFVRNHPKQGKHSAEAIELMKEFIRKLEDIEEGDSDMFPYYTIDELKQEYLGIEPDEHE